MPQIDIKPDCSNAPKKEFLRDFNIAFAEGNVELICSSVSADIEWEIFGDQRISGKEAFDKAVIEMSDYKADKLIIHHIITHGKEAAINGEMVMGDGNKYVFCDVYEFTSVGKNEIRKMSSYVVKNDI